MSGHIERDAVVPMALAGKRVDWVAAQLFPQFSRAVLARWLSEGTLTVDGDLAAPRAVVSGGELLRLDVVVVPDGRWQPEVGAPFAVLHEDADVIVVDKPAGVVVHPGAGNTGGTLINALLDRRPELGALPRAGIVHRLDKETSGVLVVAASLEAHTHLTRAIAARAVTRRYRMLAEGLVDRDATIDAPVGRHPTARTKQAVRADGRNAVTHIEVIRRFRAHTAARAVLETGRTHQIRVHMASIGHPLVGDRRYGARGSVPRGATAALANTLRARAGQALHAEHLAFEHPMSGLPVAFDAPWPAELAALEQLMVQDAGA